MCDSMSTAAAPVCRNRRSFSSGSVTAASTPSTGACAHRGRERSRICDQCSSVGSAMRTPFAPITEEATISVPVRICGSSPPAIPKLMMPAQPGADGGRQRHSHFAAASAAHARFAVGEREPRLETEADGDDDKWIGTAHRPKGTVLLLVVVKLR